MYITERVVTDPPGRIDDEIINGSTDLITTLVVVATDAILASQHVKGLCSSFCSTSSLGNVKPDVLCINSHISMRL